MKTRGFLFGLLFVLVCCTPVLKHELYTETFVGTYQYGQQKGDDDEAPYGTISLYPESDSTLLFSLFVCKGAPSYNLGNIEGRIILKEDTGYFLKGSLADGCGWRLYLTGNKLHVHTIDGLINCDFGFGVYADGIYTRTSRAIPQYFIGLNMDTVYYKNFKPD